MTLRVKALLDWIREIDRDEDQWQMVFRDPMRYLNDQALDLDGLDVSFLDGRPVRAADPFGPSGYSPIPVESEAAEHPPHKKRTQPRPPSPCPPGWELVWKSGGKDCSAKVVITWPEYDPGLGTIVVKSVEFCRLATLGLPRQV